MIYLIFDNVGYIFKILVGDVLYIGDFKIDFDVGIGVGIVSDLECVEQVGKDGVLLFIFDLINVECLGYMLSEVEIVCNFEEIIKGCWGWVFLMIFVLQVYCIQNIFDFVYCQGCWVVMEGCLMIKYVQVVQVIGYMNLFELFLMSEEVGEL